jgi:uncharacterized protein (TIGR03545 family)
LLKNRLAEQGLERALETVFQAKAEVDGLRLSILRGRVELDRMAVADRGQPMRNLFELAAVGVDLDTLRLLERKFVIDEVSLAGLRWGTARRTSGALGSEPQETPEPTTAQQGEGGSAGLSFLRLSAQEIVAAQKEKLASPAATERLNRQLEEATQKWRDRSQQTEQQLQRAADGVATVRSMDFAGMDSLEDARRAYATLQEVTPLVAELSSSVRDDATELRADTEALRAEVGRVSELAQQDIVYLRGLVDVPDGGFRGVVTTLLREALAQRLGRFSDLALRLITAAESAVQSRRSGEPAQQPSRRRRGHVVPFPSRRYPDFLIRRLAFEGPAVGPEGQAYDTQALLQDLTTNPDLWERPATFSARLDGGRQTLAFDGLFDGRSDAERKAEIATAGADYPFSLNQIRGLPALDGIYRFDLTLMVEHDSALEGTARVWLTGLEIEPTTETVGSIVRDALLSEDEVRFDVGFRRSGDALDLDVSSTVDSLVAAELQRRAGALVEETRSGLEEELRSELAPLQSRRDELLTSLGGYGERYGDYAGRADSFHAELEQKRMEYEERVSRGTGDALKKAGERLRLPGF